ncbi:MAG: DUF362 domain-containing protein [Halanaerobiales bacterium]
MENKKIYVIYGDNPREMINELLEGSDIGKDIGKKIDVDGLIGIKPNLVLAKESSSGATSDSGIAAGLIEYLQEKGYRNIVILEGSWIGGDTARAYKKCGYERLSRKYNIPLIDLKKDSYHTINIDGLDINVCNRALEIDYLINIPVLKGHCQTRITCALKNLKGCIPDSEKRRFHTLGLDRPIACLGKALKQDLVIVDGIIGDLDFEEGGNPVKMNRIIMGKDPVLIDSYAAELLGYNIDDVPYIKMAEGLGVGSSDLKKASIIELNKDKATEIKINSRKVKRLVRKVKEDRACSACYANLVHALKRLDQQGLLNSLDKEIYIGQGYKDNKSYIQDDKYVSKNKQVHKAERTDMNNTAGKLSGIGIGNCTENARENIPGCPPRATRILEVLKKNCLE